MAKRVFIISLLMLLINLRLPAHRQIVINQNGHLPGHFSFPVIADEPVVYYDDESHQIIIEGTGNANYYDVEITSLDTFETIYFRVNGTYDTIDISALSDGDYAIDINSSWGNSYEGEFTIN